MGDHILTSNSFILLLAAAIENANLIVETIITQSCDLAKPVASLKEISDDHCSYQVATGRPTHEQSFEAIEMHMAVTGAAHTKAS